MTLEGKQELQRRSVTEYKNTYIYAPTLGPASFSSGCQRTADTVKIRENLIWNMFQSQRSIDL